MAVKFGQKKSGDAEEIEERSIRMKLLAAHALSWLSADIATYLVTLIRNFPTQTKVKPEEAGTVRTGIIKASNKFVVAFNKKNLLPEQADDALQFYKGIVKVNLKEGVYKAFALELIALFELYAEFYSLCYGLSVMQGVMPSMQEAFKSLAAEITKLSEQVKKLQQSIPKYPNNTDIALSSVKTKNHIKEFMSDIGGLTKLAA